jgi:hypothetical protein
MTLKELLEEIGEGRRIVIVGGPKTGKSTLAHHPRHFAAEVRSTDELVGVLEWSEVSAEVATWFDEPGPWIIEGVATARALRKWLATHAEAPLDIVVVLMGKPFVELSKGQAAMGKGVATVWNEIVIDVAKRGARVINAASPKPLRQPQAPDPAA